MQAAESWLTYYKNLTAGAFEDVETLAQSGIDIFEAALIHIIKLTLRLVQSYVNKWCPYGYAMESQYLQS